MVRAAFALAILGACVSNTVPQSEACQEILGDQCEATKLCGEDNTSCLAHEQQVCPAQAGEIDSTKLDLCLEAMRNYKCDPSPTFSIDATNCLDMYQR